MPASDEGKVALITGAGSGIGRATAITFLRHGYAVTLTGRRPDALDETVSLAAAAPDRVLVHPADVSDPEAVSGLFDAATQRFGRLDVLFNNAGTGAPGRPLEELTPQQWLNVVGTNLNGPFFCTQAAFRIMKPRNPGAVASSTTARSRPTPRAPTRRRTPRRSTP